MTVVGDAVPNPGQLKLELGFLGIELDPAVRPLAKLRDDGPRADAKGVELILPEDVRVSTAICEPPRHSPFVLCSAHDHFVLRGDRGDVDVRLVDPPAFYTQRTIAGTTMREIGAVNGSFIAIRPDLACGYGVGGTPCAYCLSGAYTGREAVTELSVHDVTEIVRAAFAEGVAEFVYFNLPASDTDDGGLASIERHIRAVKSNFDTAVAVQMHPPASHRWIDEAYAMGVDAINFSLEIFDDEALRAYCPGRHAAIGRRRYLDALGHAASVFPSGTVWSDLVIGLEPSESTRRGIDTLASMGVLPVLSLARDCVTADPRAAADEILPLYRHLFQAVRDARINMGWIRDLNFAITPLEARFFAGEEARTWLTLQQFYRSRLGQSAARSLARLRRRLRVRRVSDSFDSSHL